jgi:hypothetical protein
VERKLETPRRPDLTKVIPSLLPAPRCQHGTALSPYQRTQPRLRHALPLQVERMPNKREQTERERRRERGGGGEGVAKSVGRGLYDARGRTRACYCLFMGGGRLSSALATAVAWRTYDPTHCRYKPFRLLPFVPFSFSPLFCLSAWTGLPLSFPTTLPLTYMLSSCCSPCRLSPLTSSTLPPSPRPGPTSSRGSYRAPTRSSWFVSSFSSAPFDMQRVCARVYDVHLPCGEDEDKTWS